jgi:hypothetical protein
MGRGAPGLPCLPGLVRPLVGARRCIVPVVVKGQKNKKGAPLRTDFGLGGGGIRYSVASEVTVALKFLQGHGWFDESVDFVTVGLEPFDEVQAVGWAEEWGTSTRFDLAFYLDDLCNEIQMSDQAFSQAWYYAKICHLYFRDIETPDVAMTVGILLSHLRVWDRVRP